MGPLRVEDGGSSQSEVPQVPLVCCILHTIELTKTRQTTLEGKVQIWSRGLVLRKWGGSRGWKVNARCCPAQLAGTLPKWYLGLLSEEIRNVPDRTKVWEQLPMGAD